MSDFDGKVDAVRKQIVATTEGGAITGEERLREHTDQLYGAILSYEGKPGDYQLAYFEALKRELADVSKEFAELVAKDLPALNDALKTKGQPTISPPPEKIALNNESPNLSGAGRFSGQTDPDGPAAKITLPADLRFLR